MKPQTLSSFDDTLQSCLDVLSDLPIFWIKTEDELYRLIDKIDTLDRVALDTEFIKRTTYFPILALVQINTDTGIYLIDAPRLNLSDLWQALSEIPQMIWYACGEDLGIFYLLADCPPLDNVIDVQIGVAYLMGDLQVGYSRAINDFLGVNLNKTESQSDWLIRPLTDEQENYAADDVRYLLLLFDVINQRLVKKGIDSYAWEDSQTYAKELYLSHNLSDEKLYLSYSTPLYNQQQIAVLQAVTMWRESLARAINQPCSFIIGKQALREIVTDMPTTLKTLSYTTMSRSSIRLYGNELVAIIKTAKALPQNRQPAMPPPVYMTKDKPFRNELKGLVLSYSQKTGIPENLLLKNRWLDEIMVATVTDRALTTQALLGYRYKWIKNEVMPLFDKYKSTICEAMGIG